MCWGSQSQFNSKVLAKSTLWGVILLGFIPYIIRAQDYLVIGEHKSLTVNIFSGDSLISTKQSGWDNPYREGLFLFGIHQSHLILLPDTTHRKVMVIESISTFNPFSIQDTRIISAAEKAKSEYSYILFQALFAGVFLSMALYNLLIFFTVKEQTFLYYVLFLLLFLLVWQSVYGFTFAYLWPEYPGWNRIAPFVLIIIQTVVAIEFTIRYLNTRSFAPQLAKVGRLLGATLFTASVLLTLLPNVWVLFYASLATHLIFTMFMVLALIKAIRMNYTPAYHYLISFSILVVTGIISVLGETGVYENTFLIKHASQFGAAIMCIGFAVGLAERINVLKKENEQHSQDLITKEMEKRLTEAALTEKNTLLKEVHHRVKNNLQIITSLLNLQAEYIEDPAAINAIQTSKGRVKSMSTVHEILYQTDNLKQIDIAGYIPKLTDHLQRMYADVSKNIEIDYDIQRVNIDIKLAIPLGLIINELVSNSFKHAFKGINEGIIRLVAKHTPDKLLFTISDNGTGMAKLSASHSHTSLGTQLIDDMTKQLNATKEVITSGGTEYRFAIPLPVT